MKEKRNDVVFLFYMMIIIITTLLTMQLFSNLISIKTVGNVTFGIGIVDMIISALSKCNLNFALDLPINILVDGLMIYTLIYGGAEGSISLLKTLSTNPGTIVKLPEHKRIRLYGFILAWGGLVLISTLFQALTMNLENREFNYHLKAIYTGFMASIIAYIYSKQAPKTGENFSVLKPKECDPPA